MRLFLQDWNVTYTQCHLKELRKVTKLIYTNLHLCFHNPSRLCIVQVGLNEERVKQQVVMYNSGFEPVTCEYKTGAEITVYNFLVLRYKL
jgi:hypothetical protein